MKKAYPEPWLSRALKRRREKQAFWRYMKQFVKSLNAYDELAEVVLLEGSWRH